MPRARKNTAEQEKSSRSWDQIFASKDEQQRAFQELKNELRGEVRELENGDVIFTVFRSNGTQETFRITPEFGNIHHDFSMDDMVIPDDADEFNRWSDRMAEVSGFGGSEQHIKGKPATKRWYELLVEDTGEEPVRIGYRIFAPWVLRAAQKVRKEFTW